MNNTAHKPTGDSLSAEVGERIHQARVERGLSLAQVAEPELSRSFLSLVERGKCRISLRSLEIVARRLDLPLGYFLDETGGDRVAELALTEAEIAFAQDDFEGCLRILDTVPNLLPFRLRIMALRGRALVGMDRYREAADVLTQGIALAEHRNDAPMLAQLNYSLGSSLYGMQSLDEAMSYLRRALELVTQGPENPMLHGKILVGMGHIYGAHGDIAGAIGCYNRARGMLGKLGDLNVLGGIYAGMSQAYKRDGNLEEALRYAKLSRAIYEVRRDGRVAASELNNLAVRYQDLGDLDVAQECAEAAIGEAKAVHATETEGAAHVTLAAIHLQRGETASGREELMAAEPLVPEADGKLQADLCLVRGELAEQEGNPEQADAWYRDGLERLQQLELRSDYVKHALAYSRLLRARGDTDRALDFALQAASPPVRPPAL